MYKQIGRKSSVSLHFRSDLYMHRHARKPVFGFLTRSDTNWSVKQRSLETGNFGSRK